MIRTTSYDAEFKRHFVKRNDVDPELAKFVKISLSSNVFTFAAGRHSLRRCPATPCADDRQLLYYLPAQLTLLGGLGPSWTDTSVIEVGSPRGGATNP